MLKDKRDELMRQFLELVRETRDLREKVERELENCNAHFVNASAVMSKQALDGSLLSPKQQINLEISTKNVMSVEIPQFEADTRTADKGDIFPYGFAFTSFELDDAITSLDRVLPDLILLVQHEKSCEESGFQVFFVKGTCTKEETFPEHIQFYEKDVLSIMEPTINSFVAGFIEQQKKMEIIEKKTNDQLKKYLIDNYNYIFQKHYIYEILYKSPK